jgi:uncharacterized DUF497 family protein
MILFEWDKQKAAINKVRHSIGFDTAKLVFMDPNRSEKYDDKDDYGEDRWNTIGAVGERLLYVVFTLKGENTVRIISARKANETERKQYRKECA